ncbi:MAG: PAS domain S-box protein [Alphaproteobacteria bacterium]|nr:PAS domain S-box protein [Alphaproteobacteria bacterium]
MVPHQHTTYQTALALLDGETPTNGDYYATAATALARGLGCACVAVALLDEDGGPARLLAHHAESRPDRPPLFDPRAPLPAPPFRPEDGPEEWRLRDGLPADRSATAKIAGSGDVSCLGRMFRNHHGAEVGYVVALDDRPLADDDAAAMFFRLVVERIAARHRESALAIAHQQSERRFQDFAIASADWFWEMDAELRIVHISENFEQLTGLSREYYYGKTREELLGNNFDPVWDDFLDTLRQHQPFRDFVRSDTLEDGRLIWVRSSGVPVFDGAGAFQGYHCSAADITEQKKAEEALRRSEKRFHDFAEASGDWFWEVDADLRFTWVSESFERIKGLPVERYYGSTREDLLDDGDDRETWAPVLRAMRNRQPFRDFIRPERSADGELIWLRSSGTPLFDRVGRFAGYRSTTTDVSLEIRTGHHLRDIEDRFIKAIDGLREGIALWDRDDRLVMCNTSYREFSGSGADLLHEGVRFEEFIRGLIALGLFDLADRDPESWIAERLARHRNPPSSTEIHVAGRTLDLTEQRAPDGGIISTSVDLTQHRQFEAQLHQAQKMEAVGQLTGGIAHDFNNLLAVISGNLELLERRARDRSELLPFVGRALAATERGASLTGRLLAFSRNQPLTPRRIDLSQLTVGLRDMLRRTLGATIEVRIETAADLRQCEVDPVQLENAILNLAINARDAMPDGGRLTIATANAHLNADDVPDTDDVEPGHYVLLSVSDTGHGMPPELLERVFEPFFTTKEIGKGSGLGLSMAYGFVRQSGGRIEIDSQVDAGTKVKIHLPGAEAGKADEAVEPPLPAPVRAAGGEVILVVEDDAEVRGVTVGMLEGLGYRVLQAEAAKPALRLLENGAEADLLLTDVVLPGGMSGEDLADAAGPIAPGLKVLFMSGHPREAFTTRGAPMAEVDLLEKPFKRDDLAARVRRALDR